MGSQGTNVACDAFNPVHWSHKDTQGTIEQVVGNNAAGVALCPNDPKWTPGPGRQMSEDTNDNTNTVPVLLGRVDGKVDILLSRTDNFDKRLRAVEQRQWWLAGVGAVVAFTGAKLGFPHFAG